MTDTEILDELVKIASYPTDCDMSWGDERWRLAVEATDGFWRGLIQAMDKRGIRPNHGVQPTAELAGRESVAAESEDCASTRCG